MQCLVRGPNQHTIYRILTVAWHWSKKYTYWGFTLHIPFKSLNLSTDGEVLELNDYVPTLIELRDPIYDGGEVSKSSREVM